jgi:ABC-type Fe3+-hydroxamate transport system substrate-binding protein
MPFYTDQLNRVIEITENPERIISLVPSQTELLFTLGLTKEVIGITKFCVHPHEWFLTKQRVGGTKNIDIAKVTALNPNLIIANKEENTKEQIEALEKIAPVWISDVNTISGALQMISSIGAITGKEKKADSIIQQIEDDLEKIRILVNTPSHKSFRTAYLIWKDPYMAAGNGTFIHDMMGLTGLENVFADEERYPTIDCGELVRRNTELVLLSSEPYPFKQEHIHAISSDIPNTRIMIVDGEMFSWYGSRMLQAGNYFTQLLTTLREDNV